MLAWMAMANHAGNKPSPPMVMKLHHCQRSPKATIKSTDITEKFLTDAASVWAFNVLSRRKRETIRSAVIESLKPRGPSRIPAKIDIVMAKLSSSVHSIILKISFPFRTAPRQKQRCHNYQLTAMQWFTCAFPLTHNHSEILRWYNHSLLDRSDE